jgi:Fe-S cluster assembly protein SufD
VNGQYATELSTADTLPDGVYVGPFEELPFEVDQAFEKQFGRVANLVGKLGTTNDERFTYLNQAFFADIAVIYVPENVVVERPIHILNLSTANRGSLISAPRAYAYFSTNSQAKLIESFIGLEGNYLNVPVTEVVLESGAIVEHVRVQDETLAATHIGTQAVHQDASSNYTAFNVNFGGQIYRNDLNVWLNGSGTETRLDGVNVGTDNQVMDNHTRIDHAFPHCNSFEVYKSVLRDNAQGIFNGKIFVYEDAQKTDAKQTNQALLLSATAQMNSKPQLEIFADDVKCTHGATIGQLQKDALFYLQARGIPKAQAESLLVYAFANDVLSRISSEAVRQALENRLFDKLEVA